MEFFATRMSGEVETIYNTNILPVQESKYTKLFKNSKSNRISRKSATRAKTVYRIEHDTLPLCADSFSKCWHEYHHPESEFSVFCLQSSSHVAARRALFALFHVDPDRLTYTERPKGSDALLPLNDAMSV